MSKQVKIAEQRFDDLQSLAVAIDNCLSVLRVFLDLHKGKASPLVHVKVYGDEDGGPLHGEVVRLWERTLTDGSKVYEVHIL
jgi:hypothetical protein